MDVSKEKLDTFTLNLANGFELLGPDNLSICIPSKKASAMLGFMVLNAPNTQTRERLTHVFWSESDETRGRASMRQSLKQLRKFVAVHDPDLVHVTRDAVAIDISRINVDLLAIDRSIENPGVDIPRRLLELNPEQIMKGFDGIDIEFTNWLQVYRQGWFKRISTFFEKLLSGSTLDEHQKCQVSEALLRIDGANELACRCLMVHHANSGNLAAAMRCYDGLWHALADEFDAEPTEDTIELYAQIKMGQYIPYTDSGLRSKIQKGENGGQRAPVISVSHSLSSDKVHAHLINGFVSELVSSLVNFREWLVLEPDADIGDLVQDYKLVATPLESEDNLLISVSLIECQRNRTLWTKCYSLAIEKWKDTNRKITHQIAAATNIYLTSDGLMRHISKRDVSLEAYDKWLRAKHLLTFWEPSADYEAESLFKQVVTEWPDFVPARSSLANIYNTRHIVIPGLKRDPLNEQRALELSRRAVELDPLDARSQLTLSWSYAMLENYGQAEFHFEMACQLNFGNPDILMSCAQGLAFCDNRVLAMEYSSYALELTLMPQAHHWGYLVGTYFLAGSYESCVEAAHRAGSTISNLPGWKASALWLLGRKSEAREEFIKFKNHISEIWADDKPCTESSICKWFLESFPIKNKKCLQNLETGLREASLSVAG